MQENELMNGGELTLARMLNKAQASAPADYIALNIQSLPANGSAIAYYEFGDPNGKPLLCLHGLSISGLYFAQHDDYFRSIGVRAIAPNLMGGVYLASPARQMHHLADEVLELMDVLKIAQFDVVGFSWGTLPILDLMAQAPARIGKAGLLGAMTPMHFIEDHHVKQLKADVQLTLKMVDRTPFLHRCLMAFVCTLPVSALLDQFKDDKLSMRERHALTKGSPLHTHLSRCLGECIRTGSRLFTHGWRMFIDAPRYELRQFADKAAGIDVRLYAAEQDNVHLPYFSALIAAGCAGTEVNDVILQMSRTAMGKEADYTQVYAHQRCSIWMLPGAGRVACMLYFKEAVHNLLFTEAARY